MKYNTRLDLLAFASYGFSGGWSLCQQCVPGRTSDSRCTGKRMSSRTMKVGICSLGEHQESPEVRQQRLRGSGCCQLPLWGTGAAQAEVRSMSTRAVRCLMRRLDTAWLDTSWCLQPCRAREWQEPLCPDGDRGQMAGKQLLWKTAQGLASGGDGALRAAWPDAQTSKEQFF